MLNIAEHLSIVIAVASALTEDPDLIYIAPGVPIAQAILRTAEIGQVVGVYHQQAGALVPLPA